MINFFLLLFFFIIQSNSVVDSSNVYSEEKKEKNLNINFIKNGGLSFGYFFKKSLYFEISFGKNVIDKGQKVLVFFLYKKIFKKNNFKILIGTSVFKINFSKNKYNVYNLKEIIKNISLFLTYDFVFKKNNFTVGLKIHSTINNKLGVGLSFGFMSENKKILFSLMPGELWKLSSGSPAFYDDPEVFKYPQDITPCEKITLRAYNPPHFFPRFYRIKKGQIIVNPLNPKCLERLSSGFSVWEVLLEKGWDPQEETQIIITQSQISNSDGSNNLFAGVNRKLTEFIEQLLSLVDPKSDNVVNTKYRMIVISGQTTIHLCGMQNRDDLVNQIRGRTGLQISSLQDNLLTQTFIVKNEGYTPLNLNYLKITLEDGKIIISQKDQKIEWTKQLDIWVTGKSGSGKTFALEKLKEQQGICVLKVTLAHLADFLNNQSEDKIYLFRYIELMFSEQFKRAEEEGKKIIVHIDEADKIRQFINPDRNRNYYVIFTGAFEGNDIRRYEVTSSYPCHRFHLNCEGAINDALTIAIMPKTGLAIIERIIYGPIGYRLHGNLQERIKNWFIEKVRNSTLNDDLKKQLLYSLNYTDPTSESFFRIQQRLVQLRIVSDTIRYPISDLFF